MRIINSTVRRVAYMTRPSLLDETKGLIKPVTKFKGVYTALPSSIVVHAVFVPPMMAPKGVRYAS